MKEYYDLSAMDQNASYAMRVAMRERAVNSLREWIRRRRDAHAKSLRIARIDMDALSPANRRDYEAYEDQLHAYCADIRHERIPAVIEWIRMIDRYNYEDVVAAGVRH